MLLDSSFFEFVDVNSYKRGVIAKLRTEWQRVLIESRRHIFSSLIWIYSVCRYILFGLQGCNGKDYENKPIQIY